MNWLSTQMTFVDAATGAVEFSVNWLLQSTLLILAGLMIGSLLRKRGSAVQSVVYRTTMAAVFICPLATWGLTQMGVSGWSLELPKGWDYAATGVAVAEKELVFPVPEALSVESPPVVSSQIESLPAIAPTGENSATDTSVPLAFQQVETTDIPPLATESLAIEPALASSTEFSIGRFGLVALSVVTVWLVLSVFLVGRLAASWWRLAGLRRHAVRAERNELRVCHEVASQLEVSAPHVLRSPYLPSPCLAGIRRPVVLLPEVDQGLSIRNVLIHELAHLKRRDCHWNLLRQLSTAVFFFQPLLWKLSHRLEATSEEVCDDYVVAYGGDRQEYAHRLVDIAELSTAPIAMAGVGIVSLRSMLAQRVTRIMDTSRDLSTRVGNLLLIAVLVGGVIGTTITGLVGLSSDVSQAEAEALVVEDSSGVATPKESVEETSLGNDSPVASRAISTEPLSYSGSVETPQGEPIAGAKIWLAVASHKYTLKANRDNREGLLRELGTADEQGRFEIMLDAVTTQEIRKRQKISKRFNFLQTQLVATAEGRGLDWMPLDVFEDNPAPSAMRDTLQARVDRAGVGRFASRALKLRPESQPVRGRLVDLEGHRLSNVTVLVESLRHPDIPRLLKAFEMSWKREVNEALSVKSVGGLARSELQKLIPPVTTDENGEFELRGIGDNQLVTLVFDADRVEARPVYVLGREMETVSLPHSATNLGGAKDVFVGRDFTYAVGPSVPVEGVVTDHDTGESVANVLVYVDRLFQQKGPERGQERLDTTHMRAVTDGQGRFRITGMPPGEGHVLEAMPRKSEPYLMTSQDVSLSLEDGDAKRIEFQVKRGIWIEGRVTDMQSGEPLSATVGYLALKKNPHALEKSGLDWDWITQRYGTDSDGRYRVLGLPGPGVLLVTLQVPGYPLAAGAETIDGYDASGGIIPTIWPQQVSNWHLLKQIEPATDATSFTSDLVLDTGVSIPGRVVGPDGKPISDLYVLGQTEGDEWWRPRHTDNVRTTDRFTVYLYDGKGPQQLFFKNKDETLVGQYRLEGDAPEEIVVTLQPSVRVTGRLIENETDLPAARYFLLGEKCSLFNEKYPPVKFRIHWLFTDDEGRFEIKGLMAGLTYKMNAMNESNDINNLNRFTIDLTAAKPGDVIELGDVTGPNSNQMGKKPPIDDQGEQANRTGHLSPSSDDSERVGEVEKTESTDTGEPTTKGDDAIAAVSYSGRIETPEGQPLAGAKIWLAMPTYEEVSGGLLRELATTDEQGRFQVALDLATTQIVRRRINQWQTTLVATAEGRGLDWMPLDVFEDNATPSDQRDTLQAHIDKSLGAGRFASHTLKLRPAEQPIRGRLLDLDGHPLPNVTVLVERLRQPDIPLLLKAFKETSKDGFYAAVNATGVGVGGLARDELQKLIPPVTTDENGAFELAGIGDDQLVSLTFAGERVQAQVVHVLGRSMETVRIPHVPSYPNGAKDVFAGRDFTYVLGPSVTVEGVVKDYDTGEPVARTLVKVERLFSEGGGSTEGQLRLDTRHMRTMTDTDGRFRITGMPPGTGHVLEAKPPKSEPYLMASHDVTLSLDDGPAKEIEIPVKKGIWIEGKVTDKQSGKPLSGNVDYLALEKNPHTLDKLGLKQAWQMHRYRIGKEGRYRTLGLPGAGVLLVRADGGYPRSVGAKRVDGYEAEMGGGYLPTNPTSLPLSNWNFIKQINPESDATSFTCNVELDAGLSIPGRVVGPDGESITDLNVLGEVVNVAFWKPHATNTFTIEGYDGKGPRQLFFKNNDETLVGQYRLEGDVPEKIVVTLQPSVRVTGRLIENKTELPAIAYELHCDKTSLFNGMSLSTRFRIDDSRTDDDGRFEIRGLVPGMIYDMDAANPQHFVNGRNEFQIDLTTAKSGDVIELGDVTGPNSARLEK